MALPNPGRILVVDDEVPILELVRGYLERDGFVVDTAADGPTGLAAVRAGNPDVVVLDVMLPGIDGIEVCRQLRTFSDAYVLMLTARGEEIDRIMGLTVGADDYLVKPFSPRELVARVKALLRRPRGLRHAVGAGHPGRPRPRRAAPDGPRRRQSPVELTALEFDLLAVLARDPGVVIRRQALLDRVWGPAFVADDHLVDVHVANLRRKLGDDPARPRFVETVRGRRLPAAGADVMLARSLRARLLVAFLVVVAAAIGTVAVAVLLVGPGYFAEAMGHVPGDPMGEAMGQATQAAFAEAMRQALGAATIIAVVTATVVSLAVAAQDRASHHRARRRRAPDRARPLRGARAGRRTGRAGRAGASRSTRWPARSRRPSAAASSWSGDVAHELRTPLTTLDGYLEGLEDGVIEPSDATWRLLRAETGRLTRLVSDLAELWRAEAHQLPLRIEAVDLAAVAREVGDALRAARRAARDHARRSGPIRQSRGPIATASPRSWRTTCRTRSATPPMDRRSSSRRRRARPRCSLRVTDQGPGLAADQLEAVFERFYRVDPARSRAAGGSGIGLAIVRALAEAMGGRAWAESAGAGTGATFVLELPAA